MSETLFKLGRSCQQPFKLVMQKEAASLAVQFSSLKLKLDINIKREELDLRNKEHEFSVRVHVEDRLSDGFYFNLQVKSSDTIQDLKKKVMLKYNFPEEVQRWIIGKKIPENENKLSQCSVKGSGHTLYLYLVTARSVGLSKQDYDMRHRALQSPEPLWPVPLSPLETQSHSSSNNTSPALASSPVLGMEEIGLGHSTYGMTRQTSRRSLNSGSNIIQEMLMGPNLSSLATLDSRQKSASLENAANGMELWGNEFIESSIASTHSTYRLREPSPTHPPETEKIGWVCPKCTFINLPVRPGCEMCTGPKPPGYKVPSGYHMTPEERMLLENDQLLEKMTREAEPAVKHEMVQRAPPRNKIYEQLRDNLMLIEAMNSQSPNNNINQRDSSSGNNQIIGNDLILIPGGSDWAHTQDIPMRASPSFEHRRSSPHHHGRSSMKSGSVAVPPPTDNQQQLRISQASSRSPFTSRRDSRFTPEPAYKELSDSDFPSDEEYS